MLRNPWMPLAAALLTAVSFTTPARAGQACVPPEVGAALADCAAAASLPVVSVADLRGPVLPVPPSGMRGPAKHTALTPRPLDAAETTLAGGYQRFACDDRPVSGDTAARDRHMEIAYRRGRLYFGANRFQEAAVIFREIATNGADTAVGVYAMQLYLESVNILGAQGAVACYDDIARDVPVLLGLHCEGGRAKANAAACVVLERIERDLERLAAEKEIVAAGRLPGDKATDRYRTGAERYLEFWRRHGEAPCVARQAGCDRMEEILYNAARAFQAAREIPKAIAVWQILVDPRYHLEGTEIGKRAPYQIGSVYQSLAEYELAATWYERFAATAPKSERAPDALVDAVVLRLALGQDAQALRDSALFIRAYQASKPAQAATVAFAIGAHYVDRHDWVEARQRLGAAMASIDRHAPLDIQIQAHGLLGRTLAKTGDLANAGAEYGKVRAYWKDAAAVVRKMGGDERKLGKALDALGEARVFFAEEKRQAAEAPRLPAYSGSGRREDIAEFAARKLAPAVSARRKAVDEAEKAYREVLQIEPVPPPRWAVAAAARVARMRGRLAAEVRALPAPAGWGRQGASPWAARWEEIRAAWRDMLIDASEPEYQVARAAHRRCVELSVQMQSFDPDTRRCSTWLERNFPAEHPRLDEIAPRPVHLSFGLEGRPPPLEDPR